MSKKKQIPTGIDIDIGFARFEDGAANEVMKHIASKLPKEWGITQHGVYLTVRFPYEGYHHTVSMMVTDISFFDHNYVPQ